MPLSRVLKFLRNEGEDYKGRRLLDMQYLSDEKLERSKEAFHWMFPIDIPSSSRPDLPTLTEYEILKIKEDIRIKVNMGRSLDRIINFYENNQHFWITQRNHNFKRLTRILRSLWLAERTHDYVSLQKCLDRVFEDNYDIIGEETFLHWKHANDLGYLLEQKRLREERFNVNLRREIENPQSTLALHL